MWKIVLYIFVVFMCGGESFGAHPLITDDAGTAGTHRFQIELNGEIGRDEETEGRVTTKETVTETAVILTYGFKDHMDLIIGMPYQYVRVSENNHEAGNEEGISDLSVEFKWRFFEKEGTGLALKTAVLLPTGDEEKGLGNGKVSYGITFITTKETEHWVFHMNLGYMYNRYEIRKDREENRQGVWHVSAAAEKGVTKDLTAVANIGMERNADRSSSTHPAFLLMGFIYSVSEKFDVDMGIKAGLNKPETDYSLILGAVLSF